jgi:phage terminase large subunit-like protein
LLHDPRPSIACWVLARGLGKSTLTAALALQHIFDSGIEGARAVVIAQDERSSRRMLATAARMVELNDELAKRTRAYADRIVVQRTDSQMVALPGEAHRIEGDDASLAICDEIGVVRRDAYESLLHSTGKRAGSQLLAIGTPSPPSWREASPLLDLVLDGRANPAGNFRLVEYGSDVTHPVDCEHCWAAANPGLGDLVQRDSLVAALPPRSRESEFRRARLAQWLEQDDAGFLPPGVWAGLSTGEGVPDGAQVVLSLDGSFSSDSTALLVATVDTRPHFDVVGLWESAGNPEYRVPILEVEDAIRPPAAAGTSSRSSATHSGGRARCKPRRRGPADGRVQPEPGAADPGNHRRLSGRDLRGAVALR